MILKYISAVILTFVIAIVANLLRFKGGELVHKTVFVLASLLVVEMYGFLFDYEYYNWILLVFILVALLSFGIYGGIFSTFISLFLIVMHVNESVIKSLLLYLAFAFISYFIIQYIKGLKIENHRSLSILIHNSKQLNVYREVSLTMQQTFDLEKILQTILTSVTAGYGLGFNRAMILLMDKKGKNLKGIMGTGPMTAEEGFATWEKITKNKYKLSDLIQLKETEEATDQILNDKVKRLKVSLQEPSFLLKALQKESPLYINEMDEDDEKLLFFMHEFNMTELAVFPLINQGSKVGVLIIDNPVNRKPILASDIDSVLPLANQAAIAIYHSKLYNQIEEMALKDGLTGLYNQRDFQKKLDLCFPMDRQNTLSLIMLDIDFFKHYNDTNGHLLGNQVLIQLADVIKQSVNEDFAFRFGGEEFVVLLPDKNLRESVVIAEQIRRDIEHTKFPNGENQPLGSLTVSIGVSTTDNNDYDSPQQLVDAADNALYKAKEMGKNKVVTHKGVHEHV